MLTSLRIENFAIVSFLELDFQQGMTVFTGETGAGKSIMIDALMLALGGRADTSVIRVGQEKCDIQACFQYDAETPPAAWLAAHDIPQDHQEIFLRRVIYAEGRSKSYINGLPFPLQKIKELSEMLVDIHGQHQHQTLLHHATHRQQLDQYANHQMLLTEVADRYQACQQIKQKIQNLQAHDATQERIDLLQFQLEELSQLQLQPGEMQALHEEHQLLHHARDYLQNAHHITTLLSSEDTPNLNQALHQALQILATMPAEQTQIKNASECLNNAIIQCDEALDEIKTFSERIQLDPERLQVVETRISALHLAARKYHVEVSQLPDYYAHLQNELSMLQNYETQQQTLHEAYQKNYYAYEQAALKLRESRQRAGEKLAAEISQTIRQLGMPKGYITLEITPLEKPQIHGMDKIEYKVCTNPGSLPDSLAKIASGGELSRISLAIQMIAAQRGATPTLLFDEVDVGIGGATAALVGQLLRKLGERLQLFCVTHQPQVASCAHHHFLVKKHTDQEQTFSTMVKLDTAEKIDEIARMLGGLTITEQTLGHARELLTLSNPNTSCNLFENEQIFGSEA